MNKMPIALLCLLTMTTGLFGQLTPVTNQYILSPQIINPAFTGNRGLLNFAAFYRQQWIGVDGAPQTGMLMADAPFHDSKLGLGIMIVNDKIGVTKETKFSTSYAYRISLGDGNLAFGLGAGIIATNTAWANLIVNDPGDENFLVSSRVFIVPEFSFGAYFSLRNYFVGASAPRLLGYKYNFDENKYTLKFEPGRYYYMFNTGYLVNINSSLRFLPSTLLAFSRGRDALFDLNAHLIFSDRVWVGGSFRNKRSIGGLLQVSINDQIKAACSYDFDIGRLRSFSNGSYEIMVRYEFRKKVKVISPLIF
jgi:type IX secretion system PorP/SprF family membrane protein